LILLFKIEKYSLEITGILKIMKTRGITFLEQKKVKFEVLNYEHEIKGAEYAATVLHVPIEQMIKSIVTRDESGKFYFCLMPGNVELSPKKVAKALGVKTITLAKQEEAERVTGYLVGGISPFGSKKNLPALINNSLEKYEDVYINAGARGIILKLKFADLNNLLRPIIEDLV
jgi:Cys-tRNA(Pro)/Cys-tRNA(Cys) deacylase